MSTEDEIRLAQRGGLMVVTLNRPRALNALSLAMCRTLARGLASWQADPTIHAVLIKGEGERAFCAGGDIRALHAILIDEGIAAAVGFYAVEYPMNAQLHHFSKPYVALLDGITMGGGVGVSVHGSHRVATERTLFAMPETGIGFFPDVGATYVLPRLSGALGMYLGLTGARLRAADCLFAGLATHHVPAERLAALEDALATTDLAHDARAAVDRVLADFHADPGSGELPALQADIDRSFGQPRLEAVLDALSAVSSAWGPAQLDELGRKSPTSLAVTFRQLQNGRTLDFAAAMRLEYRLVHRFMAGHDFREGVRALIIDKDNLPCWRPRLLAEITPDEVAAYFAPLAGGDLALGEGG
jgi:enoyl-CoA hydratase/carnithine racemase